MRRDPVLGAAIKRIGECGLASWQHDDHLVSLVGAIVSQQLSTKAAATIRGRLMDLFPERRLTSPAITALDDPTLRGVGLSRQKIGYLRDLCAHIEDGRLQLPSLDDLPDEEVIVQLTQVKGFGRWTSEMFLMFRLHRPDVLPVGDLGIIKAMQRLYGLRKPPTPERMMKIGDAWRPYLWKTLEK
jgi:DNA-3-methyladenine glycosylase II